MIKGIQGVNGVIVGGGNTSLPYINQNTNNPMQGMIRVWGTDLQVFDGTAWIMMNSSYATIELTSEIKELLDWAKEKRNDEEYLLSLPSDHPAVTVAKKRINDLKLELLKAKDQLKVISILSEEHEETTS